MPATPLPDDILARDYLTEAQLAKMLHRDVHTLREWWRARKGPPRTKVGKSIFYSRKAVEEWLLGLTQSPVRGTRPGRRSAALR